MSNKLFNISIASFGRLEEMRWSALSSETSRCSGSMSSARCPHELPVPIAVIQNSVAVSYANKAGIFFFRFGFFGQVCGGFLFFSFTQQQFCVEEYDFAVVGIRNTVAYGFGTFDVAVEHLLSRQENQRSMLPGWMFRAYWIHAIALSVSFCTR